MPGPVTLAVAGLLLVGSVPVGMRLASDLRAPTAGPDPLAMTGVEYVQMSPREREAYVAGFVTGAATLQALAQGGPLEARLDALRRSGELRFPLGVGVYATALREYYTSPETVHQRVAQAMVMVHEHLVSHGGEM